MAYAMLIDMCVVQSGDVDGLAQKMRDGMDVGEEGKEDQW